MKTKSPSKQRKALKLTVEVVKNLRARTGPKPSIITSTSATAAR